jgi:DNA (cytosine-5)-methyltransferase 1
MHYKPSVIDLFCGCGGFGLGAELAGFHTLAAIDIDPTLQSSYKLNLPGTNVIEADLSTVDKSYWNTLLKGNKVDGIIGGPPCQAFSRLGAGKVDDSRRNLILDFYRHVNLISPKFFVMENVEGILDSKNIPQLIKGIDIVRNKYSILGPFVIDASEWGAPTKRKRVLVIGYDPKRMNAIELSDFLPSKDIRPVTVKDAIDDLREPIKQSKDPENFGWAEYHKNKNVSEYARRMRARPPIGLGYAESIKLLKNGIVSGNFDTIHSKSVSDRYFQLAPGKTDPVSRAKKLSWDGLCPTLRAGTGSDKGSHQAVRPIHPTKGRVITVREAARLQGFPDWFCFHHTKWHSFRMIGNSVSPIVSKKIMGVIYNTLAAASFNKKSA